MSNVKQKVIVKFKDPEFPDRVRDLLVTSGKVKVQGIGVFEVRKMKERVTYNIGKGEKTTIPAYNKIVFRPTSELREAVQKI
jgi:nucleoid DNA-binding protein